MKNLFKLILMAAVLIIAVVIFSVLSLTVHGQQLIGEATVQKDIVFQSYSPSPTTNKLYVIGTTLYFNGSALSPAGSPVTSVALTMPTGFTVTGSPVTGAGTLAVTTSLSGILKGTGSAFAVATADVDYAAHHTTLTGYGITDGVPTGRTINTHSLGSNLVLTNADIGSEPALGNPAADGYILSSSMVGARTWIPTPATGVTNVATGTGLTGGPITATGTISVNGILLTMANLASSAGVLSNSGSGVLSYNAAVGSTGITMSTGYLLGRNTASTGAIEQIALGTNLSFSGTTLNAAGATLANPTASLASNTAVNGTATSAIRSDGAFAISTSAVFQFARLGLGVAADANYPLDMSVNYAGHILARLTNANTTWSAAFAVYDGTIGGFFRAYGSSFSVASLASKASFGPDGATGIVVFSNASSASGSTGSISLRGGGYDTAAEMLFIDKNGSQFTNGTVVHSSTTDATTTATGSVQLAGGMGVAKTIWANAIHLPSSGFAMRDTSAAYDLTIASTSSTAFTAGRTLTLDLVNAARTLKISGNPTISQDYSTTGTPQFARLGVGMAADAAAAFVVTGYSAMGGAAVDSTRSLVVNGNVRASDQSAAVAFLTYAGGVSSERIMVYAANATKFTPSAGADAILTGLVLSPTIGATDTTFTSGSYGIEIYPNLASSAAAARIFLEGIRSSVYRYAAADLSSYANNSIYGFENTVGHYLGADGSIVTGSVTAMQARVLCVAGNITTGYGLNILGPLVGYAGQAANPVMGTYYAIRLGTITLANGGTITTEWGISQESTTAKNQFLGVSSTFGGWIQTGAPNGGTAAAWKLGSYITAAAVLDAAHYVQLDVGGTLYKLALAQ